VPRTYELLFECSPKAHTDHVGRDRNMLDFWKKSEKNDRFSLIVLGVCLVVLVAVVLTRL